MKKSYQMKKYMYDVYNKKKQQHFDFALWKSCLLQFELSWMKNCFGVLFPASDLYNKRNCNNWLQKLQTLFLILMKHNQMC